MSSALEAGLSLAVRDLVACLRNTRAVVVTLLVNFVAAPLIALLLIRLVPLQHDHAQGLLVLAFAAGAPFLPKLVQASRGDLSLAVAMMALLTIATIVVMPAMLPLLLKGADVQPWDIARPMLLMLLGPLACGMVLRQLAATVAALLRPILNVVSLASILVAFGLILFRDFRQLAGVAGTGAILVALAHTGALFAAGWYSGGNSFRTRTTLALCAPSRNIGAAMIPAASVAESAPGVTVMVVVSTCVIVLSMVAAARRLRTRETGVSPEGD